MGDDGNWDIKLSVGSESVCAPGCGIEEGIVTALVVVGEGGSGRFGIGYSSRAILRGARSQRKDIRL